MGRKVRNGRRGGNDFPDRCVGDSFREGVGHRTGCKLPSPDLGSLSECPDGSEQAVH